MYPHRLATRPVLIARPVVASTLESVLRGPVSAAGMLIILGPSWVS